MRHIAGYVWAAAKVLHPDDFAQRRRWVMEKLTDILWGRAHIPPGAMRMRRTATMTKLGAAKREPVDDCADDLLKYQPYMQYDVALADGNADHDEYRRTHLRHLVKDRWLAQGPAGTRGR